MTWLCCGLHAGQLRPQGVYSTWFLPACFPPRTGLYATTPRRPATAPAQGCGVTASIPARFVTQYHTRMMHRVQ
jgi:hypothetical protein